MFYASNAMAEDHESHVAAMGDIRVVHPWARAADAGGSTLVFMDIENAGGPVRLTRVRTDVAERAELVGIVMEGTELTTAAVGAIDVPVGEVQLDPGGLAIKLDGLSQELAVGDGIEMVLSFEPGGELTVHSEVEPADAREHSHAGHSHD
ncbi:copper chaperone PCu(A)C [Sinorhizobium americanum]|uniref:Copper metallochaperone n=1 Tax=Sinorhizobium americanum TaxID=194963 RepID=A0A1L3LZD0_9HYPH|nr:copper chaperone PCu(A)C [Sinorhizobium americanum]APG95467.1 copper metallochaperone [Sinorhizobium americanum]